MHETIHIYHTNDLHSHFENWPKIAQYIDKCRGRHNRNHEEMLLVDIGDHIDRSHPMTEATLGQGNVELMNELHYDYVTIGNNEGITLPHEALDRLYEKATFQVVVGNIVDPATTGSKAYFLSSVERNFLNKSGAYPSWAKPYRIHDLHNGLRIGFIGLTVYFSKLYELLGWGLLNPFEVLGSLLEEVEKQSDIVILLSHLGMNDDEKIAEQFSGIDIILGGHTHHLFENGKIIGDTLLCGAGKFGKFVGHVEMNVDSHSKQIINKKASVIQMDNQESCEKTSNKLQQLCKQSEYMLQDEITYLNEPLELDWFKPSPFSDLLVAALKEWCSTEIAMVNAGVLLHPLPKGRVTKKDLHRICPHPINPCKVELRGDQLKEVILQANTEKMERLEIKGLGFRGKIMGKMVFAGVDIKTVILADGFRHVQSVNIEGEPINPDKIYQVATLDMFTFGNLYPEIKQAPNKTYFMPEMLRDLLAWKLTNVC